MSEEIAGKKSGRRKFLKVISLIVFVLGLLYYSLSVFVFTSGKTGTHPLSWIVDIAIGHKSPKNKYRGMGYDVTQGNPATCDSRRGKNEPLNFCTHLFTRDGLNDCSWWRFENCVVLEGEAYLLSRPDLLGKALSAIHDPCRYLPSLAEIDKHTFDVKFFRIQVIRWRYRFGCGGVPHDPTEYEYRPERVIVKLFDQHGNVVFITEIKLKE